MQDDLGDLSHFGRCSSVRAARTGDLKRTGSKPTQREYGGMPTWRIGIHRSNPRKLHALAVPFYSVIPLTEFDRYCGVAKLLKLEREKGL